MAIITVSRGSFAGGQAIAQTLAQRLGCALLSREQLVQEAAADYGIAEQQLIEALEQPPRFWQHVHCERLAYIKCATAVLLDHAREGQLVYHGYFGHLLLCGLAHVLRVRVTAERSWRVRAAMEACEMTPRQANAHIDRVDKQRDRWAKLIYGVRWDDPSQHDLIVNVSRITIPSACEMIIKMSESERFRLTLQARKELEDQSLSCRVSAAMARHRQTRGAALQVIADGGKVVIAGNIASRKLIDAIPRIAEQVEGVRTLKCEVGMGRDWYW